MNRLGRVPLLRRLALALITAQAVAYAVAPLVEARTTLGDAVAHIERSHTAQCAMLHRSDLCIACQLLAVRVGSPLAAASILPVGGRVLAESSPRTTHHAPRTPPRTSLHSRAPPAFS